MECTDISTGLRPPLSQEFLLSCCACLQDDDPAIRRWTTELITIVDKVWPGCGAEELSPFVELAGNPDDEHFLNALARARASSASWLPSTRLLRRLVDLLGSSNRETSGTAERLTLVFILHEHDACKARRPYWSEPHLTVEALTENRGKAAEHARTAIVRLFSQAPVEYPCDPWPEPVDSELGLRIKARQWLIETKAHLRIGIWRTLFEAAWRLAGSDLGSLMTSYDDGLREVLDAFERVVQELADNPSAIRDYSAVRSDLEAVRHVVMLCAGGQVSNDVRQAIDKAMASEAEIARALGVLMSCDLPDLEARAIVDAAMRDRSPFVRYVGASCAGQYSLPQPLPILDSLAQWVDHVEVGHMPCDGWDIDGGVLICLLEHPPAHYRYVGAHIAVVRYLRSKEFDVHLFVRLARMLTDVSPDVRQAAGWIGGVHGDNEVDTFVGLLPELFEAVRSRHLATSHGGVCGYPGVADRSLEVLFWKVRWRQLAGRSITHYDYDSPPLWVGVRVLGEADRTGLRATLMQLSEVLRAVEKEPTLGSRPTNWNNLGARSLGAQLPGIVELLLSSAVDDMGSLAYALIYECGYFMPTPAICDRLLG
jgi:hypothetical protein